MEELPYRKHLVGLDQSVLIISDLHKPYSHPDAIPFLKAIKENYKPEIIINVGDELDKHAVSFHNSESSLFNADKELERAIEGIQELRDLFPKMFLCESNHGSMVYRRLKAEGIPIRNLKPLHELYDTPSWSWHHEIMIETHLGKVVIVHGKTSSKNKLASEFGCSAIQGHFHSLFEITWHQSVHSSRFNMIVGCLIDSDSMAFAYGKNFTKRPILGVGWLNELGEPSLIRMQLDSNGRWNGKL